MDTLLHRRESMILTTIELIDQHGIHQVSTREIAKHQGITEGAIYRHFKSKNELLLEVLALFSKYDKDIFYTAAKKDNGIEAIEFVFDSFSSYYENYPSMTAILMSLDIMRYDKELKGKVEGIVTDRLDFLQNIIQTGHRKGQISPTMNSEEVADILYGTFVGICSRWRLQGYSFSLHDKMMNAIQIILTQLNHKE